VLAKHASIFSLGLALDLVLGACHKGPERPRVPSAGSQTLDVSRTGGALRGVASDGETTYAAFAPNSTPPAPGVDAASRRSRIEARRGTTVAWAFDTGGLAGELAIVGPHLVAAIDGSGRVEVAGGPREGDGRGPTRSVALRGDPASIVTSIERSSGRVRWHLAIDSTEWALVSSLAAIGDDILVGGSFGGTLRIGAKVVSSAGGSDGFVARLTAAGQLVWLVRLGGAGADAVQGVAATSSRIAIAGTVTSGAELHGVPLPPIDERLPYGDAFVAELDASGGRTWSSTFGSRADDAVAGVAIDASGRIVVAATVHDVVQVGSISVSTKGPGDGLVVWYGDGGERGSTAVIGGADFDGLRAITAVGDHVVVGGFFSGTFDLAGRTLTAGGGDDAFLAALDPSGTVTTAWHVGGAGREDIASLAALPGGFVAGIAHTAAAAIDGDTLPAPDDPASGAALVVRGY
jgi:hypothetical protein